ncbi:MAG: hypothetical protein ABI426_08010 [Flavobacterium sp.]
MEPNKVEKQIREKLNAREINPSATSWDRLDAMLSVAENKKPKRNFKWLFVAAGIVGFVFVGLFLINLKETNSEINTHQTVVESTVEVNVVKEKEEGKTVFQTNEPIHSVQNLTVIKSNEVVVISTSKESKSKIKKKQGSAISSAKLKMMEQTTVAEVIPQKAEEKSKETSNVTTLLAASDPNILERKSQGKPKLKINANALLSQVDGEIELTFRQKTIKIISKKFESAREAIVSRNQE